MAGEPVDECTHVSVSVTQSRVSYRESRIPFGTQPWLCFVCNDCGKLLHVVLPENCAGLTIS